MNVTFMITVESHLFSMKCLGLEVSVRTGPSLHWTLTGWPQVFLAASPFKMTWAYQSLRAGQRVLDRHSKKRQSFRLASYRSIVDTKNTSTNICVSGPSTFQAFAILLRHSSRNSRPVYPSIVAVVLYTLSHVVVWRAKSRRSSIQAPRRTWYFCLLRGAVRLTCGIAQLWPGPS